MTDIPRDVPEIEKIFSGVPVTLQFQNNAIIGWATAHQHKDTGDATIFISLQGDAAKELGDLAEFMEIYSLGFAGVPRKESPS